MSEKNVTVACIALSTAILTLLIVAEALGLGNFPVGGSPAAQAAIVYLGPLGACGVFFALVRIAKAFRTPEDDT